MHFFCRIINPTEDDIKKFNAQIEIIGINPFVKVPDKILAFIFKQAGKDRGAIPVRGAINEKPYRQTLVKYAGLWRLYTNVSMLKDSPKRIGEKISVTIEFDPESREIPMHAVLKAALENNRKAESKFESLSPSRKKEIVRYIHNLKSEEAITRNVLKIIKHLTAGGRFAGRD
jgi:hypothetical protein